MQRRKCRKKEKQQQVGEFSAVSQDEVRKLNCIKFNISQTSIVRYLHSIKIITN